MGKRSRRRTHRAPQRGVRASIALGAIIVAVTVFAYSMMLSSPAHYGMQAVSMVAGASAVSANVPDNQYNTLAKQLEAYEAQLDRREASLSEREGFQGFMNSLGDYMGFVSFFLSIAVFILLSINFYLDAKRGIKLPLVIPERFKVDLRNRAP